MIKKRFSLLFASLIISFNAANCFAQSDAKIAVTASVREIGTNLSTGQPITATEYKFAERIHDFKMDTLNNYVTMYLRGLSKNGKWLDNKGPVIRYNTKDNMLLWAKNIAYQMESIEVYDGVTFHTAGAKSFCLDNETGKQLWKVENSVLYASPKANTAIGYKRENLKGDENRLEGTALTDGKTLWQRDINREFGWNTVFYLNDSTLIIAAAGLHSLNLKNGKGWDYNTKTGKNDYTATVAGAGLGILAGALTGFYSIPTGHNTITGIASNVLRDSTSLHFASKEQLVKLDLEGKIIWKTPLDDRETSTSVLIRKDGNIFLINSGYAKMGQRKLSIGKPFIALYNGLTGDCVYKTFINGNSKEFLQDYKLVGNEILLLFNDKIEKYAIKDGSLTASGNTTIANSGDLSFFLGNNIYIKKGDVYISLIDSAPDKLYIYTSTNAKALVFDSSMKLLEQITLDDYYSKFLTVNSLTFIKKQKETIVVNRDGSPHAQLQAGGKSVMLNNKLYTASESSFLEIDINSLTK